MHFTYLLAYILYNHDAFCRIKTYYYFFWLQLSFVKCKMSCIYTISTIMLLNLHGKKFHSFVCMIK